MSLLRAGRALFWHAPPLRSISARLLAGRARSRPGNGKGGNGRKSADNGPLLNAALRNLRQVRLVSASGSDEGLMSGATAYARARDAGLDLMQVHRGGPNEAAVVRLVDYGAFLEAQRRKRYEAARRKRHADGGCSGGAVRLKQVRLSPSTGPHDLAIKLKQARGFLVDGHRVRVYMQFRRGQGRLKEDAKSALAGVARELAPLGRLRGVANVDDVEELFKDPPPDPNAAPDAPRPQKPLEVVFDPLPKRLREKAAKEEVQAGSEQTAKFTSSAA